MERRRHLRAHQRRSLVGFHTRECGGAACGFRGPYVITVDVPDFLYRNFDAVVDDFGNLVRVPS